MKNIIFSTSILFVALFIGCTSDPKETSEGSNTTTPTTTAIDVSTIKFLCQSSAEPNTDGDAPRHEVFLQIGNSKVKVADILNCEILGKDAYAQNQIPPTAIAAVGGWWAGAGDYLYIIEEGGNYVVKKGFTGEEVTNNDFDYKPIMTFDKNGNEVF